MDPWAALNLLIFVGTPLGFFYGWRMYRNESSKGVSPRLRASLMGLLAATVSVGLWVMTVLLARAMGWRTTDPGVSWLIGTGELLPLLGLFIALFGRPRLILPIVLTCIGTSLFWYGTTVR